ncbi:hypothetical protein FRC02_010815 [Tulasnella sp. 418]|nr:hypothetical protein FRC02_010815 [Tulasnella sp. 418]
MEIQIDIPTQRQFTMCPSYKRRRSSSPVSSVEDRPHKRLGLIVDSNVSSRAGSEDWIHANHFNGLRLNSASPNVTSFDLRTQQIAQPHIKQEDVTMEDVETNYQSSFGVPPPQFAIQIPHQVVSASDENDLNISSTFVPSFEGLLPENSAPHINLIPPTPQHARSQAQMQQIQIPSSTPSPRRSPSQTQLTPNRKTSKTPTMGPRTDCEKCRLKVPGHWMHYD